MDKSYQMHRYVKSHWEILLVLLASMVPAFWFKSGYLITGTDLDQTLFPLERLLHRMQTWDSHFLGGTDRSNNVTSLVFVGVQYIFSSLGLDAVNVEKYSMCFWMAYMAIAMYFLLCVLTPLFRLNNRFAESLARLAGVLFFIWTFYNNFLWLRLQLNVTTAALFPVLLGIIFGLYFGRLSKTTAFLITFAASFLSSATGLQPPLIYAFLIALAILFTYLIFYPITSEVNHRVRLTYAFLIVGFTWFLASVFWIFPLFLFIVSSGYLNSTIGANSYNTVELLGWVSSPTSFVNIFRNLGDVPWWDGYAGEPYWPEFGEVTDFGWMSIFSFIQLAVILSALAIKTNMWAKRLIHLIFLMSLVFLFLSKGLHEPFGGVFQWFVNNLPGFWIHRAPWQKFGMITTICFSILLAASVGHGYRILEERLTDYKPRTSLGQLFFFKALSISILLGFLISTNWLFISGQFLPNNRSSTGYHGRYNFGFHHRFPDYIFAARDFINSDKSEFKVFQLPDAKTTIFNWGYAGSADISFNIFDKSIISRQYGEGMAPPNTVDLVQDVISRAVVQDEPLIATRLLGLLNVKYVLQRNDIVFDFFGSGYSPEVMKAKLKVLPGLNLVKTFGKWDIYQLEDSYRLPHLYLGQDSDRFSKRQNLQLDELLMLTATKSGPGYAADFSDERIASNIYFSEHSVKESAERVSLDYQKVNATSYLVSLKNKSGNQRLTFQESYHPLWRLYMVDPATFMKYKLRAQNDLFFGEDKLNTNHPSSAVSKYTEMISNYFPLTLRKWFLLEDAILISDNDHYIANFYSNGWLIDLNQLCRYKSHCIQNKNNEHDVYFVLEFMPQSVFVLGSLVTIFVALIALVIFLFRPFRYYYVR